MTTNPLKLPQYKGRPVPWITRWTGEIIGKPYTLTRARDGKLYTTYDDDIYEDKFGGTLWQREGIQRGGEPQWKQVSTYRQRFAMRACACQVCGQKINEKPIRFLMPADGYEIVPPDEFHDKPQTITLTAPTCSECIPLALKLCPHLKKNGYQILKVATYRLWGVYGEIVVFKGTRMHRGQTYVEYDTRSYGPDFHMGQVMAKQLVVELEKYVIEDTVVGTATRQEA
jgi:hypothetical protein